MEPTRNPLSGLYERIVSDPVHLAFYNARVARGPGCWEWQGKKNSGGYGQVIITLDGKKRGFMAPRVALTIKLGREPVGDTRHTCDNPPCCNPDHLIEGSRSENMRDAYQRGRIDMDAVLRGIREYAEKRRAAQLPIPPADETGWSE